jgi:hypothetical protein
LKTSQSATPQAPATSGATPSFGTWTLVTERLPEIPEGSSDVCVIGYRPNSLGGEGSVSEFTYEYTRHAKRPAYRWRHRLWGIGRAVGITHWMPFPEHPAEDGGEARGDAPLMSDEDLDPYTVEDFGAGKPFPEWLIKRAELSLAERGHGGKWEQHELDDEVGRLLVDRSLA